MRTAFFSVLLLIAASMPVFAQTVICRTQTQVPEAECEALVALYDSTDGANWANNRDWLTSTEIGTWYGVVVSGGNVTALLLDRNQLSGAIPPQLGSLAILEDLRLSYNELIGAIPPQLGSFAYLQRLGLSQNLLSGAIPPELGSLASLRNLGLSENRLSGAIPPELGSLANLRRLDLDYNELSGAIPPELGSLANLRVLLLDNNELSGAISPELGHLTNLQLLVISENQLSGSIPLSFTKLTNLLLFRFGATNLCEPWDATFQTWLSGVGEVQSTGVACPFSNQPPTAQDDVAATTEDSPVVVDALANDSDPDGSLDAETVTIVDTPNHGAAIVTADGMLTYTPASGFVGVDTLSYTVEDNLGLVSNAATVTVTITMPTAIDDGGVAVPYALEQNYPNPYGGQTTIRFALLEAGVVYLSVYDVLGREIAVLVDAELGAGRHEVHFRAMHLPGGLYVYRIEAGAFTKMRTMLLVQ